MSKIKIATGNKNDDKILTTMIELIGTGPVEDIGMRQVAELAGVTPPTLYNRFGSKDRLISAALEYYYRDAIRRTLQGSPHQQQQVYRQVFDVAELYANACRKNGGYVNALMSMHFKIGEASPVINLYLDNCETFRHILHEMKKAGELRDSDSINFLAEALTDICYSIAHAWCQNRIKPRMLANHLRSRMALVLQNFVNGAIAKELEIELQKLSAI